jgi:hypothetical protein
MLLARNRPVPAAEETDHQQKPAEGPAWAKFLTRLVAVGYFQGELEGSARYCELAAQAAEFWANGDAEVDLGRHGRLDRLVNLVAKIQAGNLLAPPSGWLCPPVERDDDESWLEVTPESLDRMLAARFGVPAGSEDQIPAQFSAFLSQMSDMAGVADMDGDGQHGGDLDFSPSSLVASMQKLLGEGGGDEDLLSEDERSSEEEEDEGVEDPVTRDYMDLLDQEVSGEVQGRTDLADPSRPLDVDSGLLANLLASYSAQLDMNGPAASIFSSIRINPGQKK